VTPPVLVRSPEKPFLTATGGDDQKTPPENPSVNHPSELTTALETFGPGIYTGESNTVDKVKDSVTQALKNIPDVPRATVAVQVQ
jgi:hypothetical protein